MAKHTQGRAELDEFVAVFEELVERGEWIPALHDEDLPAMVWIDFMRFWTVALRNRLSLTLPTILVPLLRKNRGEAPYPNIGLTRRIGSRREYLVTLADPFGHEGPYRMRGAKLAYQVRRRREEELELAEGPQIDANGFPIPPRNRRA